MIRVATTTFPTVGLTRWMNISPIETLFLQPAAVKAGSFSEKFNFGLGFTGWSPTVEQVVGATLIIFYNDQDLCFCKKISFQCDFWVFSLLDNLPFTQNFTYHLARCDKSRLSVVVRNFQVAFENNSMNPLNIFLKNFQIQALCAKDTDKSLGSGTRTLINNEQ